MMIYDYCILGAGLSGALIAAKIKSLNKNFCLIDKGRSSGGRLSCKRIGSVSFNHGLQSFDCDSENRPWIYKMIDEKFLAVSRPHRILVPANQIVKKLLMEIPVLTNEEIVSVTQQGSSFIVKSKSGSEWVTKKVICTFPAPQAVKLFGDSQLSQQQSYLLQTVIYTKKIICFVDTEISKDENPDYAIEQLGQFSMITFSDQVSEKYFEVSDLDITANLKNDYGSLFRSTECVQMNLKKWRYANCKQPVLPTYLSNEQKTLFFVGDYLGSIETTSLERTVFSAEAIFSLLEHH